jgi:hypothetical protein
MIELPTRAYLTRNLDRPFAWLKTFCFYGVIGGAATGYKQGGVEPALIGMFVAGVAGAVIGLLFGSIIRLCRYLFGRWKSRRQGGSPACGVSDQTPASPSNSVSVRM